MTDLRAAIPIRSIDPRRGLTKVTARVSGAVGSAAASAQGLGDRLALSARVLADKPAGEGGANDGQSGPFAAVTSLFGKARAWVSDTITNFPKKFSKFCEWGQQQWDKHVLGATHGDFKSLVGVDDPSDVNDPSSQDVDAAKEAFAKHRAAEVKAVAALPEAERARYEAVAKHCEGSTLARRGLQRLLLDGQLPGAKDLRGEATLLDQLHGLATQPLAPGIDRGAMVAEVVAEVENPVRINQHGKGTCGATTAQILLIRQNPTEYVRLVRGLSSPDGAAQMFGGKTIRRHHDWAADNDNGRSNPSRMFQSAVMEFGQILPFSHYDNTDDKTVIGGVGLFGGLMPGGLAKALDQLTGKDYESTAAWRWNRGAVYDDMKKMLAAGQGPIPISLTWNGGGHFVQVDKVENGKVTFTNPHGRVQSMDESEFRNVLTSIIHPA